MAEIISEREYMRTVRLHTGDVGLELRMGQLGDWHLLQIFTRECLVANLEGLHEDVTDLMYETLDAAADWEQDALDDALPAQAALIRRGYRAMSL
jgi:hypothetical protein